MSDLVGVADCSFVTHGQLVTALGPAPREHGTAIFTFHARSKTMGLGPFAVIRLESSFRHL